MKNKLVLLLMVFILSLGISQSNPTGNNGSVADIIPDPWNPTITKPITLLV